MRTPAFALTFIAAALLQTGCVSSGYRAVAKPVPPVPVDIAAREAPAEATLHSVIVLNGPGSWKRQAYWDEYLVSLTNRGDTPLIFDSVRLTGFGRTVDAGGKDPWALERNSKTWWQKVKSNQGPTVVAIGVGGAAVTTGLAAASFAASWGGGAAAGAAYASAAAAAAAATPIYAVTVVAINFRNKNTAATEYNRRRIGLPVTIGAGQTVYGSFFFPITPSPESMILRGTANGTPYQMSIGLGPLAGLHLAEPPTSR